VGCLSGSYRRFVTLLAVPPHSSRQLLCPSASFIQPLLIRSIPPCSLPYCCFSAWHPAAKHSANQAGCTVTFTSLLHGSLGSISLLPRYFISAGFSPPAANFYFARRQPHLGCVHLAAAIAHSSLISQSIAKVHLHSSATFVPCGKYTSVASYGAAIAPDDRGFPGSPFVGARRPPPLRRTSLFRRPSNGSQSLQCGQVCRTAMLLFCRRRFYRKYLY